MEDTYDLYLLVNPATEFYIGITETGSSKFIVTDTCFYRNYLRRVEGYNETYDIKNFVVAGPEDYAQKIVDGIKQINLNDNQIVKYQEEKRI